MTKWDAKYAAADREGGGLFGAGPNEYLRLTCARRDFAAASALMLADGDGRNGRFLAGRGAAVTAVDLSAVGTERAREWDRAAGVDVTRIHADLASWQPEGSFDLVGLFYLHCEPVVRDAALARACACLAPGGWLVVEGFAKAQAARPGLGPPVPDNLYDLPSIRTAAEGLTLVEALEGDVRLDEGQGHRGLAAVVRLTARRF